MNTCLFFFFFWFPNAENNLMWWPFLVCICTDCSVFDSRHGCGLLTKLLKLWPSHDCFYYLVVFYEFDLIYYVDRSLEQNQMKGMDYVVDSAVIRDIVEAMKTLNQQLRSKSGNKIQNTQCKICIKLILNTKLLDGPDTCY